MPVESILVAPFSSIYVGDSDVSGSPLTLLQSDTQDGVEIAEGIEETYHAVVDNSLPDTAPTIIAIATFLTPNTQIKNLARGRLPNSSGFPDGLLQFQTLSVLFVHPNATSGHDSVWIPKCYVKKQRRSTFGKKDPTVIQIQFVATNRDLTHQLFYERSNTDLLSVMGGQYPL